MLARWLTARHVGSMDNDILRQKWDGRYRDAVVVEGPVAQILLDNCELLPRSGNALDLACGLGTNALWLSRAGFEVDAWDLSPVAVEKLSAYAQDHRLRVHASVRDIVADPPAPLGYDLIVVTHFLERALCAAIATALRPGGLLFYQTFGPTGAGPNSPEFRLRPGELPKLFPQLETVVYAEESEVRLVARRL